MNERSPGFGAWLRRRRRELELTQAELSRQVGYSTIALRKIESEERRPSLDVASRLADSLGIPAAERSAFIRFARGDVRAASPRSPLAAAAAWQPAWRPTRRDQLPAP